MKRLPKLVIVGLIGACWCQIGMAEIYIYRGADGERMVSDRPLPGYELLSRRDTVRNAGHILAERPIPELDRDPAEFKHLISAASTRYDLDPALIEAVIRVESGFNPHAVSRAGATGLMQLMKSTAERYDVYDRFNPGENIEAGTRHLRYLMERFNGELRLVLAAYNAGASAVERYRGVPPFPETEHYISKVLGFHLRYRQAGYGE